MKYTVNTEKLGGAFLLPAEAADKWLKLATHTQLKVLICCFRNIASGIEPADISKRLLISEAETEDALVFWAQAGLLKCDEQKAAAEVRTAVLPKEELPTREDVIRRGMEDKNVAFLLREAQMYFGRGLKQNESAFLVSLYDDSGMDTAVILYLLSYAASCGKCNLSFIKKHSARWLGEGVETVAAAEECITRSLREDLAWNAVQKAFGMEKRNPSEKEKALCDLWINEWQTTPELLKAAYDVCVDTKSKFSFPYTAAVLEAWHKKGIKTVGDVKNALAEKSKNAKKEKQGYAGFDLEAFEKSLNED